MYRVTGIVKGQIKIEFNQNKEELIFSSREEAEKFIQTLKESEGFPENYSFLIEEVKTENV